MFCDGCHEALKGWAHLALAIVLALFALFNALSWIEYPRWRVAVAALGYFGFAAVEYVVSWSHLVTK